MNLYLDFLCTGCWIHDRGSVNRDPDPDPGSVIVNVVDQTDYITSPLFAMFWLPSKLILFTSWEYELKKKTHLFLYLGFSNDVHKKHILMLQLPRHFWMVLPKKEKEEKKLVITLLWSGKIQLHKTIIMLFNK